MKIMHKLFLGVLLCALTGCMGTGNYTKTYRQLAEPVGDEDAFMLDKGARPRLIVSKNFDEDLQIFTDQNFIVLGQSHFNGPPEKIDDAVNMGKELGVTHVLVSLEYLYDAQKKAWRTYENYDYVRSTYVRNGVHIPTYEAIPDPISVPYYKQFGVYQHKAVYLVKLKADPK